MSDDKKSLRKMLRGRLAAQAACEIHEYSEMIFGRVMELPEYQAAGVVMAYASMPGEVDTHTFLRDLLKSKQKTLVLPRVADDGSHLEIFEVHSVSELYPRTLGILEPHPDVCRRATLDEVNLVLVPGLGFDARGYRLGRGKGHYDKMFASVPSAQCVRVGVFFEAQRIGSLPVDIHDVRMDCIVTERGTFRPNEQY
ncbi:MAG: 5-formyltetrahydrofolate cyclo-ligase [Verrucomicrobiae bacterium]|nr:5-formyltetrahydrofolate cyclo-ligase [Verrucomicrobiae bacterium]